MLVAIFLKTIYIVNIGGLEPRLRKMISSSRLTLLFRRHAGVIKVIKAAKYEIQKPSTCRATLFRCKFSSMFPVFHLRDQLVAQQKQLLRVEESCFEKLRKVERGSTLSNKFWLSCSFFIKLTTCRATNLLVP